MQHIPVILIANYPQPHKGSTQPAAPRCGTLVTVVMNIVPLKDEGARQGRNYSYLQRYS
jgi:hypothetical protein